jgi:MoaA/NifB/PqqE/SkfB family radical SAM enzyme
MPEEVGGTDFANILFAGPCNRACWYCIGRRLPDRVNVDNLDLFPLRNLDALVDEVNVRDIRQVVFTGTVTDPQLYRHEARLLELLRGRIATGARYSVHTNGVLALAKMDTFNLYDKACISFPSFEPATYERHMGSRRVPDLARIVERARIPVKVSCVVDETNVAEVPRFVERCRDIGVTRLVFRKLFGETRHWSILEDLPITGWFRGCPVRSFGGMEVTCWDFDVASCRSVNLFADGTLGTSYLLSETPQLVGAAGRGL